MKNPETTAEEPFNHQALRHNSLKKPNSIMIKIVYLHMLKIYFCIHQSAFVRSRIFSGSYFVVSTSSNR